MTTISGADLFALIFIGLLALQRLLELMAARRHAAVVVAEGFHEVAGGQMPFFVALHAGFLAALVGEILTRGSAWQPRSLLWAAAFAGAQGLRVWCIRSLGHYWNTRIYVRAGMHLSRQGPYRRIRHPNYVAVAIELSSVPLMVGAWRTAITFSVLNLAMMVWRIPTEERAIRQWADPGDWAAYQALPRFIPRLPAAEP
jgi:methyltransferase